MVDWTRQINVFKPVSVDSVAPFAYPGEMKQAVDTFNRAIRNWHRNSQDIAFIALRKLAVSYPAFPQPSLMLGFCLAQAGQEQEALTWIDQALEHALPNALQVAAEQARQQLIESVQQEPAETPPAPTGRWRWRQTPASVVLEPVRRRSVRLASDRERRQVIRQGDREGQAPTRIREPFRLSDYWHLILPAGALLVLVGLLVTLAVWLPRRSARKQASSQDPQVHLTWLLERMEALADQPGDVADLLDSYRKAFEAAPQTSQPPSPEPTQTAPPPVTPTPSTSGQPSPTAAPSPSPSPSPAPSVDLLADRFEEAALLVEEALPLLDSDLVEAADRLLLARDLLEELPQDRSFGQPPRTAEELLDQVNRSLGPIAVKAASRYRQLAEPFFKQEAYEEALTLYLKAYTLNPESYGGGVAYYTGRCYQLLGDKQAARPYYEYVVTRFRGRDIARSAAHRLEEMG